MQGMSSNLASVQELYLVVYLHFLSVLPLNVTAVVLILSIAVILVASSAVPAVQYGI